MLKITLKANNLSEMVVMEKNGDRCNIISTFLLTLHIVNQNGSLYYLLLLQSCLWAGWHYVQLSVYCRLALCTTFSLLQVGIMYNSQFIGSKQVF